jgi:hypothetical protein
MLCNFGASRRLAVIATAEILLKPAIARDEKVAATHFADLEF